MGSADAQVASSCAAGERAPREEATARIVVRRLDRRDAPAMSRVHRAAFRNSALTKLGEEAVRRYYEWQMDEAHESVSLGAFERSELIGLCVGGVFHGAFSGYIRKNRAYLAWRVVSRPWALASSEFRERVQTGLRSLCLLDRTTQGANESGAALPPGASFGIQVICTHPSSENHGIGQLLMAAAEGAARVRGFRRMHLTVHPSNRHAVMFYERLGWTRVLGAGSWQGLMIKRLL